jgi:hypothetical protein
MRKIENISGEFVWGQAESKCKRAQVVLPRSSCGSELIRRAICITVLSGVINYCVCVSDGVYDKHNSVCDSGISSVTVTHRSYTEICWCMCLF